MKKAVIAITKGEEKLCGTVSEAARFIAKSPQTVLNYMSKNKTDVYTSREGRTVKILRR